MSDNKFNLEDYNFEEEDYDLTGKVSQPINIGDIGSYNDLEDLSKTEPLDLPTAQEDIAEDKLASPPFDIRGIKVPEEEESWTSGAYDWIMGKDEPKKAEDKEQSPDALGLDFEGYLPATSADKSKGAGGGGGSKWSSSGVDQGLAGEVKLFNQKFLDRYPDWKPPKLKDWKEWTGSEKSLYDKQLEVASATSDAIDKELAGRKQQDADMVQTQMIMKMIDALVLLAAGHMGIESDVTTVNFDSYFKERAAFHKEVAQQAISNLRVRKVDKMAALGTQEMDRREYNKMVQQNAVQTYNAGIKKFATKYKVFTNEVNLRYKMGKDKQNASMARSKFNAKGRGSLGSRLDKAMGKAKQKRNSFIRKAAMDEYKRFNSTIKNAFGDESTDRDTEDYRDEVLSMRKKKWISSDMAQKLLNTESASDAMAMMNMPQWKMVMLRQFPDENDYFTGAGGAPTGDAGSKKSKRRVNYQGEPHYEYVERDIASGKVIRVLGYEPIAKGE